MSLFVIPAAYRLLQGRAGGRHLNRVSINNCSFILKFSCNAAIISSIVERIDDLRANWGLRFRDTLVRSPDSEL